MAYGASAFSTNVSVDAAGVVLEGLGGREAEDEGFGEVRLSAVVRLTVQLLTVRRRMCRKLRHRRGSCDPRPCSVVCSMREYCDLFMVAGGHSLSAGIPYFGWGTHVECVPGFWTCVTLRGAMSGGFRGCFTRVRHGSQDNRRHTYIGSKGVARRKDERQLRVCVVCGIKGSRRRNQRQIRRRLLYITSSCSVSVKHP